MFAASCSGVSLQLLKQLAWARSLCSIVSSVALPSAFVYVLKVCGWYWRAGNNQLGFTCCLRPGEYLPHVSAMNPDKPTAHILACWLLPRLLFSWGVLSTWGILTITESWLTHNIVLCLWILRKIRAVYFYLTSKKVSLEQKLSYLTATYGIVSYCMWGPIFNQRVQWDLFIENVWVI